MLCSVVLMHSAICLPRQVPAGSEGACVCRFEGAGSLDPESAGKKGGLT